MTSLEAMQLAIETAKKGQGFVSPNPLVGCVILDRSNQLLAVGYHAFYGQAHAEVHALEQVKDPKLLEGAHMFVTLEPCAHEGKTGSCAKKIATLPLAAVTFGLVDPNPLVSGQGAEILKKAGIKVEQDLRLEQQLEELAEVFLTNMRQNRAFIAVKIASSLDGHMAVGEGESQWITSSASRKKAHELRLMYDAILIGNGTFLKDNPSLDIRGLEKTKNNKVVILDPHGKTLNSLKKSKLFLLRPATDIFVITKKNQQDVFSKLGVCALISEEEVFSPEEISRLLYQKKIYSVLVEGGPNTIGYFLNRKFFDRFYLFQATKVLGNQNWSWSQGLSINKLDQGIEFDNVHREFFENDLFLSARLKSKNL